MYKRREFGAAKVADRLRTNTVTGFRVRPQLNAPFTLHETRRMSILLKSRKMDTRNAPSGHPDPLFSLYLEGFFLSGAGSQPQGITGGMIQEASLEESSRIS